MMSSSTLRFTVRCIQLALILFLTDDIKGFRVLPVHKRLQNIHSYRADTHARLHMSTAISIPSSSFEASIPEPNVKIGGRVLTSVGFAYMLVSFGLAAAFYVLLVPGYDHFVRRISLFLIMKKFIFIT